MTAAGKRMSIRIDKNAFDQFRKEKAPGMKMKEIAAKIGVEKTGFSHAKGQGYFSLENLSRMSKFFGVNMWNLPFVNDEAYTISFKLTTNNMDLHLRAKMIDQIRGLLANGIPQDKVRDIVLSDILAGKYTRSNQSDSESKACLASTPVLVKQDPSSIVIDIDEMTPNGVQNKRLYVENVSDPEPLEMCKLHSELSEAKDRIAYMERALSDSERIEAKNLAQAIVAYLKSCSEDKCSYIDLSMSGAQWEYRTDVMKIHAKWSAIHKLCEFLDISVKERPLLDSVCFFITNDTWSTTSDAQHVADIKRWLYEEVEFIGRYPIKTNTNENESCEKEEE